LLLELDQDITGRGKMMSNERTSLSTLRTRWECADRKLTRYPIE
jgi:hypothetical protein